MGRRKSSAAGSEVDGESIGSGDFGSRASGGGGGGRRGQRDLDEEVLEVDPFEAAVELLYEKRATTRESALSAVVSLLSQFRYDDCAFREDTLTQLFLASIRKGKEAEIELAAKALGLHVATLGASNASEGIYQEAEPVLEPLILTGKGTAARTAAVEALAMLCFVGSEGTLDTLHTMQTLWRVLVGAKGRAASAPVVVAALRSWAFLLTTVPSYQLTADFVEQHLGALAQLLNGSDVEVRGAAGEGIALLWHLGDLSSLPQSPSPQKRSSDSCQNSLSLAALASGQVVGSPSTVGAVLAATAAVSAAEAQPPAAQTQPQKQRQDEGEEGEEEVDSLEAIVERMRDLAKNRGDASRLNKGDRASSRGTFRDLLAIIEGDYVPEQKIKLRHGDLLMVSGLLDNIRLNFLRAYLAEAFQSHLQSNELLHEVFRFQPSGEPEERLTPIEKRLFRSKSSSDVRDRTELRKKERSTSSTYKHGSLADY